MERAGKALVSLRRLHLLVHVGQPGRARVLHLYVSLHDPQRQCADRGHRGRRLLDVPGHHVLGAGHRYAASRWRLHLAEPHPRRRAVITVAGVVTGAFLLFNIVKWITDTTYGINNSTSFVYLAFLYVPAIVVYVVALLYRRRQGIDLRAIHAEIPVE